MRIQKEQALGLVIDIQERLFPVIHEKETLEKNVGILVEGLKALEIPIFVTEQYKKGLGDTIGSLKPVLGDYLHIEKLAFSCCDEPSFAEALELSKKRTVIIAGIESHICVLQTAIDLRERGFYPVVVEDCVSSRTADSKRIAMERLRQEGVVVTSYESVLFELCRFAGTDAFKAVSKLVK
ncbi:MAG: hydrolase [Breznakibacter sp.]